MGALYSIASADIIRAGGRVTVKVNGWKHRIRSDYPVVLKFNPRGGIRSQLSSDTETFLPNPAQAWYVYHKYCDTIELSLPGPGFGAGGKSEVEGFNGFCIIESEDQDADLLPIDPRLLATHCYSFYEDTGVAQVDIVQADFPIASWLINGKLPSEFFVASVSVHKRDSSIAPVNNPHYQMLDGTSEITCFRQANGAAGERNDLWSVAGAGAYTVSFPFLKMPLAALLAPWSVETPTIAFEYTENRTTHMQSQIVVKISGAVRW